MQLKKWLYCCTLLLLLIANFKEISSQQQAFELPVQLVGFPFIVLSVRITNFLKKLSYSVSPGTYRSRNRRQLKDEEGEMADVHELEKYLVSEFGERACVIERVCLHYSVRAQSEPRLQMDWSQVFSQYKQSLDQDKEFYLLSVFLGDIIGSSKLCHHLGRKRNCEEFRFTDS